MADRPSRPPDDVTWPRAISQWRSASVPTSVSAMTASPAVDFHHATLGDVDAILPLIRSYYDFDKIPFDETRIRRAVRELVADGSLGEAWLLRDGDASVGYFVLTFGFDLEFGGRQATLTDLYVAPSHRRRGLGSASIRLAESVLARRGIEALELQVERDNAEALAFYQRLGFEEHDRAPLSKRVALLASPNAHS
jgi:ribosomal protein S18 acetylase RimI-like enzyme